MNWIEELAIVAIAIVLAVEFGVWMMKAMLSGDPEHHNARTPIARIVAYAVGALGLIAFTTLATGWRPWIVAAILVLLAVALSASYRKPIKE